MATLLFQPLFKTEAPDQMAVLHATPHDRCAQNVVRVPSQYVMSVEIDEFILMGAALTIDGDLVLRGDLVGV